MSNNVIHPSTRVADLLGLLLVLKNEFGGKTDLFELEERLEVDLDDFMPIVYMANELGFATIGVGDIIITDKGLEFIESNFKKRKEIIKESLERIEPFKTAKELKEFTIENLNKALLKKGIADFNSTDGKHKLELILNEWGVYSGFLITNSKYKVSE